MKETYLQPEATALSLSFGNQAFLMGSPGGTGENLGDPSVYSGNLDDIFNNG